jgi:hypothetical protein
MNLTEAALVAPAGPKGVPVFNATTNGLSNVSGCGTQLTSAGLFAQWYTDVPGVNRTIVDQMTLTQVGSSSTYVFDNTGNFFPLDAYLPPCAAGAPCGWGKGPNSHDFGFTSEVR